MNQLPTSSKQTNSSQQGEFDYIEFKRRIQRLVEFLVQHRPQVENLSNAEEPPKPPAQFYTKVLQACSLQDRERNQ